MDLNILNGLKYLFGKISIINKINYTKDKVWNFGLKMNQVENLN